MRGLNDLFAEALSRPYAERTNDCVSLVERAHGIERPAAWRVDAPEAEIVASAVANFGSVEAAYEAWLRIYFVRAAPRPLRSGQVVILKPPDPLPVTLGLVDPSCMVRFRAGNRLLSTGDQARTISVWDRGTD